MTTTLTEQDKTLEAPWSYTRITFRPATLEDELFVITAFSRMLRELEPLGHDVLPTDKNIDFFWAQIFARAIVYDKHGIILAFSNDLCCIGASFFTPEYSVLDTPPNRAVAHGIWVDPAWRSKGVARTLQEIAHTRLRDSGFTRLISYVVSANVAGMASAKAGGAEISGYMTTVNLCKGD